MTYAAVIEWMEKDERERFDRQLAAKDPNSVSHGTQALMGLMGGSGPQPRRAR